MRHLGLGKQAAGLAQPGAVQSVSHAARVGEMRLGHAQLQVLLKGGTGTLKTVSAIVKAVVELDQHLVGDAQQFLGAVVRKVQVVGNAAAHAGVGRKKGVHAVFVAGQDHHQVVALVFHDLQQDLYGFLPVVALVFRPVQVIGLVDEQHAAHGFFEHLAGFGCGVADVLAHQVVAGDRHQVPFAHITQAVQDLRHAQRHRGLARARVARKAHVQAGGLGGQAPVFAQAIYHQKGGDVAHPLLDRSQPHQALLEFSQHGLHLRFGQHLGDGQLRCGG